MAQLNFQYRGSYDHEDVERMESDMASDPYYAEVIRFLKKWLDPRRDRFTVQTSGSTGIPKRISLSRASMEKSAAITASLFELPGKSTALMALPVGFIAGKMMLVRAIVNDWTLYIVKPSLNPMQGLEETPLDFAAFSPMQVELMTRESAAPIRNVGTILLGGAPIMPHLEKKLAKVSGRIYMGYGMTETASHIAIREIDGSSGNKVYSAIEGVRFRIDDIGRLIIDADHLDETVHTNDLVKLINDQRFEYLGRKDNIINTGGIKICPEPIERHILETFGLLALLVSEPDEHSGEKVILLLESARPLEAPVKQNLVSSIAKRFGKFAAPKKIIELPEFIRSENGKLQRGHTKALIRKTGSPDG